MLSFAQGFPSVQYQSPPSGAQRVVSVDDSINVRDGFVFGDVTGGSIALTLPPLTSTGPGHAITVEAIGPNLLTVLASPIDPANSIEGIADFITLDGASREAVSLVREVDTATSTVWRVISSSDAAATGSGRVINTSQVLRVTDTFVVIDTSAAPVTATLPPISSAVPGRALTIKASGGDLATLASDAGDPLSLGGKTSALILNGVTQEGVTVRPLEVAGADVWWIASDSIAPDPAGSLAPRDGSFAVLRGDYPAGQTLFPAFGNPVKLVTGFTVPLIDSPTIGLPKMQKGSQFIEDNGAGALVVSASGRGVYKFTLFARILGTVPGDRITMHLGFGNLPGTLFSPFDAVVMPAVLPTEPVAMYLDIFESYLDTDEASMFFTTQGGNVVVYSAQLTASRNSNTNNLAP